MSNLIQMIFIVVYNLIKLLRPGGTRALMAENLYLRQQLMIATKHHQRCRNLTHFERLMFVLTSFFINRKRLQKLSILLKPKTILKIHAALVQRKYSQLFSNKNNMKPGPKGPSQELINLVLEYKRRNPRFGYLIIAMQINHQFGYHINKDVVRRILNQYYQDDPGNDDGLSWLSFLGHTKDSLWSLDFFRVESINLKSHWVMVIMDQFSRKIIGFGVHAGDLDGLTAVSLFNKIVANQSLPVQLSSDNDPLFKNQRWISNLSVLDIEEVKTIPYTPISNPFIERLIRSIREELLDRMFFWNEHDLQQKLEAYQEYFNSCRAHYGIDGKTPNKKLGNKQKVISINHYQWHKHLRGLFQLPQIA